MRSFSSHSSNCYCSNYQYALQCFVISSLNELANSGEKVHVNLCSRYVVIRSSNFLLVFTAPRHFASPANQSGGWRMHVRRQRRSHVFLRPLPIHQPTPQTSMTTTQAMGCSLTRRIIVCSEICTKKSIVGF